jgi:hypothetical protein
MFSRLLAHQRLKKNIGHEVKEADMNGPYALFVFLFKVQCPSRAKVDTLVDKAKALKLTSIPGENITQFMLVVTPMLRDIEMCAITFSQVLNLTSLALCGLMAATDPMIALQATTMNCKVDSDGAEDSNVSTLAEMLAAMNESRKATGL